MLVQRGSATPRWKEITTSVQTLNSVRCICAAIDDAKLVWLRKACMDIIPPWSPAGSPGHEDWLEQNLGVVRQTIWAFVRLGIPQTCILLETLRAKGYTDSASLFLKDYKEILLRILHKPRREHMLNQASMIGIGPSLCDIVRVQPGFVVWVRNNADFVGSVSTTLYEELAFMRTADVATRSLYALAQGPTHSAARRQATIYFKLFPTLEATLSRLQSARAPVETSASAGIGPMRRAQLRTRERRAAAASRTRVPSNHHVENNPRRRRAHSSLLA